MNVGAALFRRIRPEQVRELGLVLILIAVLVFFGTQIPDYLSGRMFTRISTSVAVIAVMAVGQVLVVLTRNIDLSVGSMVGLGGILAALTVQVFWPLALILPPLVCGLIGFGNGILIAKAKMAPFIVTLAGLLGIRGLALAFAGEKPIGIDGGSLFIWFGQGQILGMSVPVILVVIAFAVGGLVLTRTSYGRIIFAIGGSEESARLMGLPVDRTKIIAYTTSGALAGLAGALLAARLSAGDPNAGLVWELDAISAVVVGGTLLTGGAGSMSGSLAGVLLLSILQNLINQVGTLGSYAQQVVSGFFLIVVVVSQAYLTRKERS